jgi:hypothetical protein
LTWSNAELMFAPGCTIELTNELTKKGPILDYVATRPQLERHQLQDWQDRMYGHVIFTDLERERLGL